MAPGAWSTTKKTNRQTPCAQHHANLYLLIIKNGG